MTKQRCWCGFRFHLPGELKKHQQRKREADLLLELVEDKGKKDK